MQLAHAGRKACTAAPWLGRVALTPENGGWRPIYAPSAIPFDADSILPEALDVAGIQRIVGQFQAAAGRALTAGMKVLELHAAHGYLAHQFLSPISNQRKDQYGGSFENRTRFVREMVAAVRQIWPDELPLLVRISATDWVPNGWDVEQSVELARQLKPLGVDLIDCSSGGNVVNAQIPVGPGYQVAFARQIRETGVLTGAVGLITSAQQADQIIRCGDADAVLLGREFLRQPYWGLLAAHALGRDVEWPKQYDRAKRF
jgi:2,4-dienoyl-CoA reductase-like NADH-dependent reductase (Old Yellow Enzyme family)